MNQESALLNPNLPLPLYHQLKNVMLEKIKAGQWTEGYCIPTETELMGIYGVSRTTVRQAVTALEQEGYLSKKQGKGTFVRVPRFVERLGQLTGFAEEMLQQGRIPSARLISYEEIDDLNSLGNNDCVDASLLAESASWVNINRIRLADGKAIAIERSFWPKEIAAVLRQEDLSSVAFYTVLERNGIFLGEADEIIAAVNASPEDAEYLNEPIGSALIQMIRMTKDVQGRLIEYTCTRYRGDRYTYHVKLKR